MLITQASTWLNEFSTIVVSFAPEVACREELGQQIRRHLSAADSAHLYFRLSWLLAPQLSSRLQVNFHRTIATCLPICVQLLFCCTSCHFHLSQFGTIKVPHPARLLYVVCAVSWLPCTWSVLTRLTVPADLISIYASCA